MVSFKDSRARFKAVQEQRKDTPGSVKHQARAEMGRLPEVLIEGEVAEALVYGKYNGKNGALVATNLRLLFIDVSGFLGTSLRYDDR